MVMLQFWTRNLKYAHFGKTRQCLIQVSESQWCSSFHLRTYGIAARNPEVAWLVQSDGVPIVYSPADRILA
jgi:hypothetical protein